MLDIGFLAGTGTALLFTPSVSAIGHFFSARRGAATGIAAAGGAVGGTIFPLMFQSLLPKLGFAWSTRILGFIDLGLCVVANLLIRSRLEPEKVKNLKQYLPNLRILKQPAFALTTAGVFCMEWGLFIPIAYITSYTIQSGIGSQSDGYKILAILNAGSIIGRCAPGFVADRVGRFNAMIVLLFFCFLTTVVFWLPPVLLGITTGHVTSSMKPILITYAFLFGFASGANISLTPVCVGQLCETREYGRYYATCYMLVSFGTLTGIPIAGALLEACHGEYYGVIIFTAGCYFASWSFFILARGMKAGWKLRDDGKWIVF
jgi:MFS family permease